MRTFLSQKQVSDFVKKGFLKLEGAFSDELAAQCRDLLWQALPCSPDDPSTWHEPLVWIGEMAQLPFEQAANTPRLKQAYDQLVGKGHWLPRSSLGAFPVRFPSPKPAPGTGWHVDASFAGAAPLDYTQWRINVHSKGRGLLMLFLFTDVHPPDAPTRLRIGSHLEVAKLLAPAGAAGMAFGELAQLLEDTAHLPEALATGPAGTVYLCHPFLVHAAQPHRGQSPRLMAQPALHTVPELQIAPPTLPPVWQAIRMGVGTWPVY